VLHIHKPVWVIFYKTLLNTLARTLRIYFHPKATQRILFSICIFDLKVFWKLKSKLKT
jgi:hypothetical protein